MIEYYEVGGSICNFEITILIYFELFKKILIFNSKLFDDKWIRYHGKCRSKLILLFGYIDWENPSIKYIMFIVWVIKHLRALLWHYERWYYYLAKSMHLWSVWDKDDLEWKILELKCVG